MAGLAGLNGPQGEAMGTFNEQLENNIEAIKENVNTTSVCVFIGHSSLIAKLKDLGFGVDG